MFNVSGQEQFWDFAFSLLILSNSWWSWKTNMACVQTSSSFCYTTVMNSAFVLSTALLNIIYLMYICMKHTYFSHTVLPDHSFHSLHSSLLIPTSPLPQILDFKRCLDPAVCTLLLPNYPWTAAGLFLSLLVNVLTGVTEAYFQSSWCYCGVIFFLQLGYLLKSLLYTGAFEKMMVSLLLSTSNKHMHPIHSKTFKWTSWQVSPFSSSSRLCSKSL